jgi:hypothetical protein
MNEKSLLDRAKKVVAEVASIATDAAQKIGDAADKVGEVPTNACEETRGAAAAATDSTSR